MLKTSCRKGWTPDEFFRTPTTHLARQDRHQAPAGLSAANGASDHNSRRTSVDMKYVTDQQIYRNLVGADHRCVKMCMPVSNTAKASGTESTIQMQSGDVVKIKTASYAFQSGSL